MSDQSIRITEKQIVDAMDEMCSESLHPGLFDAWEQIVTHLLKVRQGLQGYQQEAIKSSQLEKDKLDLIDVLKGIATVTEGNNDYIYDKAEEVIAKYEVKSS